MIKISIPGQPIAKARPRFARRGKFVSTYSPQATEEGLWIMSAREQLKGRSILLNPLCVEMVFNVARPKSHYGKRGVKASAPGQPTGKPDISNMVKFAEDCLNECFIWPDDSCIVILKAQKRYCGTEGPSTEIEIKELLP